MPEVSDCVNRAIFNQNYSDANLRLAPPTPYDARMVALRFAYLDQYAPGSDVLDLCCGSGSYLVPVLDRVRSAVGVDFSSTLLDAFRSNLNGELPEKLRLIEADARSLPVESESVDFVWSFTSLYYVPEVQRALAEVGRVLRPGGHAVLEIGNLWSLNTVLTRYHYRNSGWACPFHVSPSRMMQGLRGAGLVVKERRCFQILPMYSAPRRLFYLYPLLHPVWKRLMGVQVGAKMLDERVSTAWPLRQFAFRWLLVVEKP